MGGGLATAGGRVRRRGGTAGRVGGCAERRALRPVRAGRAQGRGEVSDPGIRRDLLPLRARRGRCEGGVPPPRREQRLGPARLRRGGARARLLLQDPRLRRREEDRADGGVHPDRADRARRGRGAGLGPDPPRAPVSREPAQVPPARGGVRGPVHARAREVQGGRVCGGLETGPRKAWPGWTCGTTCAGAMRSSTR